MTIGQIETKVIAATAGGGAGAALSAFVLWLLGITVWHIPNSADSAAWAVAAVPTPVADLVGIILTAVGTFAAGYFAPHTPRVAQPPAPVVIEPIPLDDHSEDLPT